MIEARSSFSLNAAGYAEARPRYPAGLYSWILSQTKGRDRAWDCACGSGQATRDLATHFRHVFASDASSEQLAHAAALPHVQYSLAQAEASGYPDDMFDLVAVAQALHWFDFEKFWPEVRRVARRGAFFCAWGYASLTTSPDADSLLVGPISELIRPYWVARNRLLWNGYLADEIAFPFDPVQVPRISIEVSWNIEMLLGHMQTWSAYIRAISNPAIKRELNQVIDEARRALSSDTLMQVSMPMTIVAGHVNTDR